MQWQNLVLIPFFSKLYFMETDGAPKVAAKGIQLGFNSNLLSKQGFLQALSDQRKLIHQPYGLDCLTSPVAEEPSLLVSSGEEIERLPIVTNRGILQRFGSMVTYELNKRNFHSLYAKRWVHSCAIHTDVLRDL